MRNRPLLDRCMERHGWVRKSDPVEKVSDDKPGPWLPGTEEMAARVVGQGEKYLTGQIAVALAADQRAAVLSGIYMATASAVAAGVVAIFAADKVEALTKTSIVWGGIGVAACLFIAAYRCIKSCSPSDFYPCGNTPDAYIEEMRPGGRPLITILQEEAQHLLDCSRANERVMKRNAERFNIAVRWAFCSPIAGIVGAILGWHYALAMYVETIIAP